MEKKRTMWERMTGANLPPLAEERYTNPFKARIGSTVHLDALDYRSIFYTVKKIEIIDRGTAVPMTDYYIESSMGPSDEKVVLLLRVVPRDGKTSKSRIETRVMLLLPYFACGWDDESRMGIMDGVTDSSGEFVINAGTVDEKRYWRLHGLKSAESVTVTSLKDDNGDGIVDDNEIETRRIEMWGFSRITLDEVEQEINEYLYVHKDDTTGWLEIFIGNEVSPERIMVETPKCS